MKFSTLTNVAISLGATYSDVEDDQHKPLFQQIEVAERASRRLPNVPDIPGLPDDLPDGFEIPDYDFSECLGMGEDENGDGETDTCTTTQAFTAVGYVSQFQQCAGWDLMELAGAAAASVKLFTDVVSVCQLGDGDGDPVSPPTPDADCLAATMALYGEGR